MGQLFLPENIPSVVKASGTSLTLAATNNGQETRLNIGGQQFVPSAMTLTTSGTGANGLDTGSLGTIQLWYVYAIVHQTTFVPALIASQSAPSTGPSFTNAAAYSGSAYKLVGAFYTDGSSTVGSIVTISGEAVTNTFNLVVSQQGSSNGQPFTNTTISRAQGWRKGEYLYVSIFITFTGTPATGTGRLHVQLSNLNVDTSKIDTSAQPHPKTSALLYNVSTNNEYTMIAEVTNPNGSTINFGIDNIDGQAGTAGSFVPAGASPVAITANHRFLLEAVVPISGWNATLL